MAIHQNQNFNARQAFVKFFGSNKDRAPLSSTVIEELEYTGGHWALCYPINRRPAGVEGGAVMFISRLVTPSDIQIFGRAAAMNYIPRRDRASEEEMQKRDWKRQWPHYIRVRKPEFVDGSLENGVSLYEMMDALEHRSFASTLRNFNSGEGNSDPRRAFIRHPAVELAQDGLDWLEERLEAAFEKHGKLTEEDLRRDYDLDWPDLKKTKF